VRDDGAEHLQSGEWRFLPLVELEVIVPEYHPEDSRIRHRPPCEHFFSLGSSFLTPLFRSQVFPGMMR
jgi:hypothetical protein